MTEHLDDTECVVIALVDQLVHTAVRFARNHNQSAEALPDMPSPEMWRDIAGAIEGLQSK